MKKFLATVLCLVLIMSLAACGGDDGKKEDITPTEEPTATVTSAPEVVEAEPTVTYDFNDGVVRTNEDITKMFDYWTEGFDTELVATVKGDGYLFFQDLDSDGKATDRDNVFMNFVTADGTSLQGVTVDMSKVVDSELIKHENLIHIEGVWKHNPKADDLSDYRIFVDVITEGKLPE